MFDREMRYIAAVDAILQTIKYQRSILLGEVITKYSLKSGITGGKFIAAAWQGKCCLQRKTRFRVQMGQ